MPDAKHPDPPPQAPTPSPTTMPSPAPGTARTIATDTPENGRPESTEALRQDIERTRDRMSHTLDRIEHRIARRRDEVWSKATLQGVREAAAREPWRSLSIAFAVGFVLAALRD